MTSNATAAVAAGDLTRYQQGWSTLNTLLRRGGSLSGREQDCCYLNLGAPTEPRFADASHVTGLDSSGDGRGLALADWDHDGDLDVWISNRTGPRVQYFRNDGQPSSHFVTFRLQGTRANRDAIGARIEVEVEPSLGVLSRTIVAGDAYLSQSSKDVCLGVGQATRISSVRVRWPGQRDFETIEDVALDRAHLIIEGTSKAQPWQPAPGTKRPQLAAAPSAGDHHDADDSHDDDRQTLITSRLPLPPLPMRLSGVTPATFGAQQPTVLLFWAPDCPHCVAELAAWAQQRAVIDTAHLNVIALTVSGDAETLEAAQRVITQTEFPLAWATIDASTLATIEAYLAFFQHDYQRPLTVPMSLLLDAHQQLAVLYRGGVTVEQVVRALPVLDETPEVLRDTRLPFRGRWVHPPATVDPLTFAAELNERFGESAAREYFLHLIDLSDRQALPARWKGEAAMALGTIYLTQGRYDDCIRYSDIARPLLPQDPRPWGNRGAALWKLGNPPAALEAMNQGLALQPDRASILVNRASLLQEMNRPQEAIRDWESLLAVKPDDDRSRLAVATLYFALGNDANSAKHYRDYLQRNPQSVDAMGALAWIFATSADAQVLDAPRALTLATQWAENTTSSDYKALNALAAAQAANRDFTAAVSTIDRAIATARQQGDSRAAAAYESRRRFYMSGQPYRRPPAPAAR